MPDLDFLCHNSSFMSQIEKFGRFATRKIQSRGREYFERNTVRILFADSEFVSARVVGSQGQDYDVDLEREADGLVYSCDCPFFDDRSEVCKHVWATILQLEENGHLQKWPATFPSRMLPAIGDSSTDDDDFDDFEDDEADLESGLPITPGTGAKQVPPITPNSWRHLLSRVNSNPFISAHRPQWPAAREILYVIENVRRSTGGILSLEIDYREPRKNGGWKKPRPLSISRETLANLPDSSDREILARLIGVQRETWYYGPYESIYRFQPEGEELEALLPAMSRTGRLFFRAPQSEGIQPLTWDEDGPWEFRIDARHDTAGRQYEVRGKFNRGGTLMDISKPEHIFATGIFVDSGRIARFHGAFAWISFFRREESFFVPEAEADQWLETMVGLPSLPPMELPQELCLQEIGPVPQFIARIGTKKAAWGAPFLLGEIFFDYIGHVISEDEPSAGIPLVSQRQKILRNTETESLARRSFETAGFKKQRDYRGTAIWTISQSRLPGAVRDLVAAGWHVEAEGKLFRNPDSLRLHLSSRIDWFELHGTIEFGNIRVALPRLLSALRRHENTIRLDDGSLGMLPEDWLQKYGMLAGLGTTEGDHVRFKQNQAGLLDALLASQPDISCDELFERVRRELRTFQGIVPVEPPPGFHGALRPYQQEGLGWIHFLQSFHFGGCLADDMGLGKTVQVLALMEERRTLRASARPGDCPPPSLVVMPRSLVFNWTQEAARFTPALRILEHTGGERIRGHEHFDDYDVVFTTYGTLRRDALFFKEKLFDYVVLDEAQAIKNASTESAKAARLLKARHRLALSGTPIENHLGELWSLFEFLNPGMLGSASVFRLGKNSANLDEQHRTMLAQALRPFILRRTKAQVAKDLPEKVEQILFCHLETAQRALYNELRDHYRKALLDRIEHDGIEKSKIHILEALLRLRQAAIHPGLVDPSRAGGPSAKMDMLLPQLAEVLEEGHKALVFSQFTSMLGILRRRLDEEKIHYEYLDGQTRDREAPVDRFQKDPDSRLFLISLKAGGLGLNLTAAEYVYLLDPWWNPAVEAQAVDRTHRIGQTQSVFAYRLIAKDTVEEKVLELQQTKRDIADAIITQDNSLLRNLSREDLAILLD
jgi:superfamily II DNA or RNA helicase